LGIIALIVFLKRRNDDENTQSNAISVGQYGNNGNYSGSSGLKDTNYAMAEFTTVADEYAVPEFTTAGDTNNYSMPEFSTSNDYIDPFGKCFCFDF